MLGTLRLILALAVAVSHAGISIGSFHIGVPAVVVFYVLAGFVVALQWRELRKSRTVRTAVPAFYLDRALRLWPAYLAALAICGLIVLAVAPQSPFLTRAPDLSCAAANLTIVPLNFYMFTGIDRCTIIPVAWSLGLELQFYLMAPLVMSVPRVRAFLIVGSLCVYLTATFGLIDTDVWGYRLLPGTLFIFVIGILFEHTTLGDATARRWTLLASASLAVLFLVVAYSPQLHRNFAVETTFGLMIALPLIVIARSLPRSRLDDLAGAIAYPLFLLHFGVLWLTSTVFENTTRLPALLTYLAITTALALMIATAVDMPLSRLRRRFRRHDSPIVSRPRTRLLLKK